MPNVITVRVTSQQHAEIKAAAAKTDFSMNVFCVSAILAQCAQCATHDTAGPTFVRKPPQPIEAHQYFSGMPLPDDVYVERGGVNGPVCYVVTAHGQRAYLEDGDWVLPEVEWRGAGKRFYLVKDDVFRARYDEVKKDGHKGTKGLARARQR